MSKFIKDLKEEARKEFLARDVSLLKNGSISLEDVMGEEVARVARIKLDEIIESTVAKTLGYAASAIAENIIKTEEGLDYPAYPVAEGLIKKLAEDLL